MVTYRHKILLKNLRDRLKKDDIENIKLILLFLGIFGATFLFAMRILNTVNVGIETQKRTDLVASQIDELEKENQLLKYQKDAALSDSELEAQYRALGYKKPDETIYIVAKKGPTPQTTKVPESTPVPTQGVENWEKWMLKIFK